MCGVAAMRLQSGITEDDILFATYENKVHCISCGISRMNLDRQ